MAFDYPALMDLIYELTFSKKLQWKANTIVCAWNADIEKFKNNYLPRHAEIGNI